MTTKVNLKSKKLQSFSPVSVPWLNAEKIDAKVSIDNYDDISKYCLAGITLNQSILNGTTTKIDFDAFTTNDSNMSVNNWEIIIKTWWIYLITLGCAWGNSSGGVMRQAELRINDTTVSYSNVFLSNNACNHLSYLWVLQANDSIKAWAFQDSGNSLAVQILGTYLQTVKL